MFASVLNLLALDYWLASPWVLIVSIFQLWMFIDAIRQREWIWAIFIFFGWGISALFYYLTVYRASPSAMSGFELPGAHDRRRIKELEGKIHHLDKAHHHSQLGDIYFQQGKLQKAEACYRAAMERDREDIDTRAHYGQCLLRLKRPKEARPLLEGVMMEKPDHDYGHTMMALAETLMALGENDNALQYWLHITQNHSYPRAKVQLAEIYLQKNKIDLARTELRDVISDDAHAPAFQRRRDRYWISRAKSLLGKIK